MVHWIVHLVLSAIFYQVSFHFFIYEYCLVIDYVEPFWSVMHRRRDKAAIPSHIGKHKQLYPTWSTLSNCKLYQLNCKNKHLYPNCSTSNCKLSLIEILKRNCFISLDRPFNHSIQLCETQGFKYSVVWNTGGLNIHGKHFQAVYKSPLNWHLERNRNNNYNSSRRPCVV